MKHMIQFPIYLFYKYYNKGSTRSIAYESALMAISAIIFMNLYALCILINVDNFIYSLIDSNNRLFKFLKAIFLILPQYLVLKAIFKKSDVISLKYEDKKIKVGNYILVGYIMLSVAFLILVIEMS